MSLAAAAALLAAGPLLAQVTLYEHEGFAGRSVRVGGEVSYLGRIGFNDRASSLVIERGRWEVCGRGQDIATAGGAVGGCAIGASIGREGGPSSITRDVQRCAYEQRDRPEF
jgi:hypothetical protein